MAETQIIQETKDWLQENDMDLDVFTKNRKTCERSTHVILVKNVPYNTADSQLHELFSRFGVVHKTLLAPNKSLGIVEFLDAEHAKNAFKNLAYYELKREPLYLEWAPFGLVNEEQLAIQKEEQAEGNQEDKLTSKVLFVKNLNFDTTEDSFKNVFEKENLGKFTVKIVKKFGLSSGYGFVEFELAESAQTALKRLQNTLVDGHAIKLSISSNVKEEKKVKRKRKDDDIEVSNKLIIRNLAFESTKKDLRELIKNFGEVKALRLPKKMNNQHR